MKELRIIDKVDLELLSLAAQKWLHEEEVIDGIPGHGGKLLGCGSCAEFKKVMDLEIDRIMRQVKGKRPDTGR